MTKWIADRIESGAWEEIYQLMRVIPEADAAEVRRLVGEERYLEYLDWHFNQD
jgi:hypothetical protein